MKRLTALLLVMLCVAVPTLAQEAAEDAARVRFAAVDVYVDSGRQPLAAYQFELKATAGDVQIVGIEGGEHAAFREAPYYDPAAMMQHRVIIAAFSTGKDLPTGRTRVARVHVRVAGATEPEYAIELEAAASPDGQRIDATASWEQGERR
jgi:hypothetical protein